MQASAVRFHQGQINHRRHPRSPLTQRNPLWVQQTFKCGIPKYQSCFWLCRSSCTMQQRYPRCAHRFNSCSSWKYWSSNSCREKQICMPWNDIRCPSRLHPCPPALFYVATDWILNHMTVRPSINIGSSSFSDLVYADDTAFFVKDATDATDCLSSFSHSSSVFGLHTSWPKTKLQSVGSHSGPDLLKVVVDGSSVNLVESFIYLGSIQTSDGYCRSDITCQIGLAYSAMSSLNNIWNTKHLSIQTKVRVYQTLVLSILLYASETWTLYQMDRPTPPR